MRERELDRETSTHSRTCVLRLFLRRNSRIPHVRRNPLTSQQSIATSAPGLIDLHLRRDCFAGLLPRPHFGCALRNAQRPKFAYPLHVRHGRGVPAADVCVECRRRGERLRADHTRSAPHHTTPTADRAGCATFVARRCCITRTAFLSISCALVPAKKVGVSSYVFVLTTIFPPII